MKVTSLFSVSDLLITTALILWSRTFRDTIMTDIILKKPIRDKDVKVSFRSSLQHRNMWFPYVSERIAALGYFKKQPIPCFQYNKVQRSRSRPSTRRLLWFQFRRNSDIYRNYVVWESSRLHKLSLSFSRKALEYNAARWTSKKYLNSKHSFSTIKELGKYHFHECNYVNRMYAAGILQISAVQWIWSGDSFGYY